MYYMPKETKPTSIRLSGPEKRRIALAARRRGISPGAYIKRAALEGHESADDRLVRLEQLAAQLLVAVENELDAKMGDRAWSAHLAGKAALISREELLRGVDL
jgi:hypothetical protein